MPDILLKNAAGEDVLYENVEQVLLTGAQTGELLPYTYGQGGTDPEALVAKYPDTAVNIASNTALLRNYAFYQCYGVTQVELPLATNLGVEPFFSCDRLERASVPMAQKIPSNAFFYCPVLRSVDARSAVSIGDYAFDGCFELSELVLGPVESIGRYALRDTSVEALVLPGERVCTLGNVQALYRTPIAEGKGYIYVPEGLVEQYRAESVWSAYANRIRAIGT